MIAVSKIKAGDIICFNLNQRLIEVEVFDVDEVMSETFQFGFANLDGNPTYEVFSKDGKNIMGSQWGDIVKIIKKSKKLKDIDWELAEWELEKTKAK